MRQFEVLSRGHVAKNCAFRPVEQEVLGLLADLVKLVGEQRGNVRESSMRFVCLSPKETYLSSSPSARRLVIVRHIVTLSYRPSARMCSLPLNL